MRLAQISDCHCVPEGQRLFGAIDTNAMLASAIAHLNALDPPPDLVLLTGDLVDLGSPAEYAALAHRLGQLRAPVGLIPGNHDRRDAMASAFPSQPWDRSTGRLHLCETVGAWRLIGLDTLVEGAAGGSLRPSDLEWLVAQLGAAPDIPTVLALHHPPFASGIAHMDRMALGDGRDGLARIVAANPAIRRVVCGHLHRDVVTQWAGTVAMVAPSTAHQLQLALSGQPSAWRLEPPAALLHLGRPDGSLITHRSVIGDFGPARRYGDMGPTR